MDDVDVDGLVAQLTVEEQVALVGGADFWHTHPVPRLGIPVVKVTDGPNGARGDGLFGDGSTTLCVPCGSALGATWDPELLRRVGGALARQAHTKAAHVLLAPTVNLHRTPVAGRDFECYSEDPHLTARLAVGFVTGAQAEGVGTTTKHLAGNESEFERMTISTEVDDRALRELYLAPFEAVVREAGAWGVMAAYNRLGGTYCSEHPWLLGDLLDEWGFDGVVVSDWFATHSTVAAANAGLDLEMPGPPLFFHQALADAVERGEVPAAVLAGKARRLLRLAARTGAFSDPMDRPEASVELPEDRALAREAAASATVLLRNEPVGGAPVLPLDRSALRTLAVVGPNAGRCCIMGGGSAMVSPHRWATPLAELRDRLGGAVDVRHEVGGYADKVLPPLGGDLVQTSAGEPGLQVEYFDAFDHSGAPVYATVARSARFRWLGTVPEGVNPQRLSLRAAGSLVAPETGAYRLGLVTMGRARVLVDGEVVLDAWDERPPRGDAFMGMASIELTAEVALDAGVPREVVLEYSNEPNPGLGLVWLGARPADLADAVERAAALAGACDAAVVVVGTDHEWETEGVDRASIHLPGRQDDLVRAVVAAQPRTVVVVNAGSPVAMPWADDVPAVLDVWLGGQEMAPALVDVLLGETDPGGRLPTTFPLDWEPPADPAVYPGEGGQVRYAEGLLLGYRGHDAAGTEVRFPFGHGLSYTTFAWGEPRVSSPEAVATDEGLHLEVTVPVTNTGDRRGQEVVQCYVAPATAGPGRPPQELRAFAKLTLDPGETAAATLVLGHRAFAGWDPGATDPAHPDRLGAWVAAPGDYDLRLGTSSRARRATLPVTLRRAGAG